jgi:aminoglycoside phosphotransferase (APT) family kinase protein
MKENWPRQMPAIVLDAAAVARLVSPLFPDESLGSFTSVGGGLINTNYKVILKKRPAPLLLRLYQRGLATAQKELAITALVAPRVPVLRCLYFADADPVTRHPYAILDWVEAPDLQQVLPQLSRAPGLALGAKIGTVLAAIHSFKFEMFGFFDGELRLKGPIDFDRRGLLAYLKQTMIEGLGGERLGRELTRDLVAYAETHGDSLAAWLCQPCLVHGDFNAANILVNAGHAENIAAVIDWEYALSAAPAIDFGNLLRPPLDENDAFAEAVAQAYVEAGGLLPQDWRRIAQLADVFSFADILSQPRVADVVVQDTRRVIAKLLARS